MVLDRTEHKRFDTVDRYEAYVDECIREALRELSTMSQVRAASTEVQAADANALRLPVNSKGRGLTEDPVGDFAREHRQADRIREVNRRLSVKVSIAQRARAEISSCRFARRRVPDAGTQEGRLAQALYARVHGTRRAAEVYCADPSDPKSVKRQQRNIQNYLVELAKVEGKQ